MSALAIVTMVVICGVVWGGFLLLVATAVRKEGAKTAAEARSEASAPDS